MARSTFMQKSQVGTGRGDQAFAIMQKNKAVKTVQEKNQQKVSVWGSGVENVCAGDTWYRLSPHHPAAQGNEKMA